jgi:hypothetical protein
MGITMEIVNMASMIEHSKFVSVHELKQQWEDEIVAEDDKNIKMGLTKKCMSCHKSNCECEDTQTYWGY